MVICFSDDVRVPAPEFEQLEPRRLFAAGPVVLLEAPAATTDATPLISLQVTGTEPLPAGLMVAIDADLNGDHDFEDDNEANWQVVPLSALTTTADPARWQSKLLSDGIASSPLATIGEFGRVLAVSGNRAVVGAPATMNPGANHGAAFVYEFDGVAWQQTAALKGSDTAFAHRFGSAVAIDGDRIAVSATMAGFNEILPHGKVYIFELTGGQWVETAILTGQPQPGVGRFGESLALEGDTLVVGQVANAGGGSGVGRAYIFEKVGAGWQQAARLTNEISEPPEQQFGSAVAIENGRIVVRGSIRLSADVIENRLYSVTKTGGAWAIAGDIIAPSGTALNSFANSYSISGDRMVVSGNQTTAFSIPETAVAMAHLYEWTGSQWVLETILQASRPYQSVGDIVAIEGDRVVMSVRRTASSTNIPIELNTFEKQGDGWVDAGGEEFPYSSPASTYGSSIGMANGRVLVGAGFSMEFGNSFLVGAVYSFAVEPGPAHSLAGRIELSPALPDDHIGLRARLIGVNGIDSVSATELIHIDSIIPQVVAILPATGSTVREWDTLVRVSFTEPVVGVDASDLVLTGSAASGASVVDVQFNGTLGWAFFISNLADGVLTVTLAPDAGDITDPAGNSLAPSTATYTVLDNVAPTITGVTPAAGALLPAAIVDITVAFSEPIIGFDVSDIQLAGAGAAGAIAAAPTQTPGTNEWTFAVTGLVLGDWSLTLAPDVGDIVDRTGRSLAATSWTYEIPGPVVALDSPNLELPGPADPPLRTTDATPALSAVLTDTIVGLVAGGPAALDVDLNNRRLRRRG